MKITDAVVAIVTAFIAKDRPYAGLAALAMVLLAMCIVCLGTGTGVLQTLKTL